MGFKDQVITKFHVFSSGDLVGSINVPPEQAALLSAQRAFGDGPFLLRSFVRRGGRFLLASSLEDLREGETLYRRRPKSFGVSEKYIAFGKVRKKHHEIQTS